MYFEINSSNENRSKEKTIWCPLRHTCTVIVVSILDPVQIAIMRVCPKSIDKWGPALYNSKYHIIMIERLIC